VPNFTAQVAAMIGIGVGIDYALFIVTRYRTALHSGKSPEAAVVESLSTAGRAVLFAGCTVVISLLGMFFMRLSFIAGLAIGASSAVVMTMLASLTLLPAVLGFAGKNIDRLGLPHRKRKDESAEHQFWYRWSRAIQHRPVPFAVGGFLVLMTLSIPVFSLQLGSSDPGNNPTSDTTRRAYDLLSAGFGPGFNGPLVLAAKTPSAAAGSAVQGLAGSLAKVEGIAFASPALPNASGDAAIIQVIPTTSPQDHKTVQLIDHLRRDVVPAAVGDTGAQVYVGGQTAVYADLSEVMSSRLPYFLGAVLILSFLLLMVVFRSLLVPLKAVVMNLLSIGAAYGTLVAIFQWGWAKDLVGVGRAGPIESWAPMMLFAIVFGLSMDYEVFLLSRMREEYDRTHDNAVAVADGLASTARVITAAAAIMVAVFGSFVLQDLRPIKLVGLGLSVAVLIDATVVRLVLVPATMELLGDRNWWFPGWLDRLVPRFRVEGPVVDDGVVDGGEERAGVPVLTPGA
jgi:RND superfamily putative drug exporter